MGLYASIALDGEGLPHIAYYDNKFGYEVYRKFDLVVLDNTYHPPLVHNPDGTPIILGYISVCEALIDGPLWNRVKGMPYFVKKNKFWNSYVVDVRERSWQSLLLDDVIPSIFAQGFDGLFIDTIDSCIELMREEDGSKYRGIDRALVFFIKEIKQRYPEKYIAVNRGFEVVKKIEKIF